MCLCIGPTQVCRGQSLWEISSLPPACSFWRLNSSQVWQQVLLPADPCHWQQPQAFQWSSADQASAMLCQVLSVRSHMIQTSVCAAKKVSLRTIVKITSLCIRGRPRQGSHSCLFQAQKSPWHLRGTEPSAQQNRSPQISYIHLKAVNA